MEDVPDTPSQGNGTWFSRQNVTAEAWNRTYDSFGNNDINGSVCAYWLDEAGAVLGGPAADGVVPEGTVELFAVVQTGTGTYWVTIT